MCLSINERKMIVLQFKLKVYESNGQEFENFFVSIMQKIDNDFLPVKAHGNTGDCKNDGYNPKTGEYNQVYAPNNIKNSRTIHNAVEKLKTDFAGLYNYWNDIIPIKVYNYVINDKYDGCPPQINECIAELGNQYPEINFRILGCSQLQSKFLELEKEKIYETVEYFPEETIPVEIGVLNDVAEYLLSLDHPLLSDDEVLIAPDFVRKITINGLSSPIFEYLSEANFSVGDLEDLFSSKDKELKKVLQQRLASFYIEAKNLIPEHETEYANVRYLSVLYKLCPSKKRKYVNAANVIMSYYFESCDIFEPPNIGDDNDTT